MVKSNIEKVEVAYLELEKDIFKVDFLAVVKELDQGDIIKLEEMGFEVLNNNPRGLEIHCKTKGVKVDSIPVLVKIYTERIVETLR